MANRRNGNNPEFTPPVENRTEKDFQDYIAIIMRGRKIVAYIWIGVFVVFLFYSLFAKRVYQSTATILIDTRANSGYLVTDLMGLNAEKNIKNEIEILKSRSLAETVAKKLLEKKYLDDSLHSPIQIIRFEEPVTDKSEMMESLVGRIQKAVEFETARDADIIKITTKSGSPEEAALIANFYLESYYERNLYTSRLKYSSARQFLKDQLQKRQERLLAAEQTLQKYMEASGIVALDEESKQIIEQISSAEASRDALAVDIEAVSKSLQMYKSELEKQEPEVARLIQSADDSYIRLIQEQLAKLEVSRDLALSQKQQSGDKRQVDARLQEVEHQIEALRSKLDKRTTDFLRSGYASDVGRRDGVPAASMLSQMKQKYFETKLELSGLSAKKSALDSVINTYDRTFGTIPKKSIHLANLQRTRLSEEKTYLMIEEKYNEASIAEQSQFGNLDIIDRAIVSNKPVSPRVLINLIFGFFLGLGTGIATVIFRDYIDSRIQKPEDLKKMGVSPLGVIMLMDDEIAKIGGKKKMEISGRKIDMHLITHTNPFSPIAESYRQIRTNVQYSKIDDELNTILITSANPGEGKSTTVSNLAIAFAQTGKKILMIDTDLRKPNLHAEFDLRQIPGLTDVLFNKCEPKEAIQQTVIKNLDLLPCGTIPPNPSEMLGSASMKSFIDKMREKYDILLLDSPPVLAVTDSTILSTVVNGVIVVTSAGQTRTNSFLRAIELLEGIRAPLLGIVLNNLDIRSAYGSHYGYRHYRYQYGNQEKKVKDIIS